jgi:cytidine deaminase
MEDGRIITGSNQENAAYPVGLCAERVAVFKAVSSDQKSKIMRMLIIGYDPRVKTVLPVTPCGSCRQTILEYENNQGSPIAIIFSSAKNHFIFFERTSDLLPMGFNATHLNPENHSSR